jgi:hypothetical protein
MRSYDRRKPRIRLRYYRVRVFKHNGETPLLRVIASSDEEARIITQGLIKCRADEKIEVEETSTPLFELAGPTN